MIASGGKKTAFCPKRRKAVSTNAIVECICITIMFTRNGSLTMFVRNGTNEAGIAIESELVILHVCTLAQLHHPHYTRIYEV